MKKFVFAILVIAFCQLTFSQVKVINGNLSVGVSGNPSQKLHVAGNTYLNGNLGVGVANPTQKLHVEGAGLFTGNGLFNGSLGVGTTTPSQKLHVVGNTYLNGNLGVGVANPTQKLHVAGNTYLVGNVGIGVNANPSYKLAVGGDISFVFGYDISSTPDQLYGGNLIFGSALHIVADSLYAPTPTNPLRPTIYPSANKSIYLGTADKRFARLYAYIVNYHTLVQSSDMRLKENIHPCPPLLSKLNKVQSYNYNFTDEYFKDFSEEEKQYVQRTEYGFLAQEMQKIFPELVYVTDSTGMLGVNYTSMIPILTAGINEQQQLIEQQAAAIEELRKEVEILRNELAAYTGTNTPKSGGKNTGSSTLTFNLSDTGSEQMQVYQNAPNPFNERTTVRCYIPQTVNSVQLCIYDMQGVQIKCLTVLERGVIDVQIEAGALASGIYTYLLVASNGATNEAKQMILTK